MTCYRAKSNFSQFFFSHWLLHKCFFSFLIKAFVNFEKLIIVHWKASIVYKNGENLKMLIEIFLRKRIVSNAILAFLGYLKPKIFFVGQTLGPTQNATPFQNLQIRPCRLYLLPKRFVFSQPLVFGPEYAVFVEIDFLKSLQQLKSANEKSSGKQVFLKCQAILKEQNSEPNPLKMLKVDFLVTFQAFNLQLCQKIISTTNIFQLVFLLFKNTCSKENFKDKSNDFEM